MDARQELDYLRKLKRLRELEAKAQTSVATHPESTQRGLIGELGRQAGLTGRYLVEGVTAIPQIVGNAANEGVNLVTGGINRAAGTNIPRIGSVSQELSQVLTDIGLPNPETAGERVIGDASRAVSGVGGQGAVLSKMASSAGPIAKEVLAKFLARPGLQLESAAAAGGSGGAAREAGASPTVQILASIGGGLAIPAMTGVLSATGRGLKEMATPFRESGRERIVGTKLRNLAERPDAAIARMNTADDFIHDSPPTTAQASRDYGLLATERGLRSGSPAAGARFSERFANQNEARRSIIEGIAKDKATVQAAKATRDAQALPLLEQAKLSGAKVNAKPVVDKIDDILAGESGERDIVVRTLSGIRGKLFDKTGAVKDDVTRLYGIRKHIGDLLDKTTQGDAANARQATRELLQVREVIDDEINKVAPEFGKYLKSYREGSASINQMETAQDIMRRVMVAAPDTEGGSIISQAKWKNVVAKNADELSEVMTKEQMDSLRRITADLDRGVLSQSAGRVAGSDTAQNLSVANLIGSMTRGGRMPSSPLFRTLARPLSWIYKIPDESMQEMIIDAMLDPKMAVQLMGKASSGSVQSFAEALKERALAQGIGIGTGSATAQTQNSRQVPLRSLLTGQ